MKTVPLLLVAFSFLSLRAASLETPGLSTFPWELMSDNDGIASYRAEVPGSRLVAFRASGVLPVTMFKVAGVLVDTARRHEWMPELSEARLVRQVSLRERVEYSRFHTPILVSERDFVVRARAELDIPGREIAFLFESTEAAEAPPTDAVRGRLMTSGYRLREVEGGTEVEFWSHVDPEGSVAKWIVNAFQRKFPRRMLEGLRSQALKEDVGEHVAMSDEFRAASTRQARSSLTPLSH